MFAISAICGICSGVGSSMIKAEKLSCSTSTFISSKEAVSSANTEDVIFVKAEHRIINLPIADIVYIEGMSEYLRIHLAGSEKPIVVLLSMKKLEERLPAYFMRIHRSYIINLKKIKEVGKGRVIMNVPAGNASSEDLYLPIGDLYRDAFNEYLNKRVLIK